ncbi:hypothetical protein HanPSC8_Chr07g0300791 [Helianthus annuus]|nr:hypothetical protein HanPSC8_Chr07g0300791 [Helianthus annuus]
MATVRSRKICLVVQDLRPLAIPTTASANGVFSFGVSTNNSAIIINGTSSSPSIFASSFSFQSFGTNTNNVSSSSSSTVLSSTTTTTAVSSTFATSVSASAFSFGSATASSTTLVAYLDSVLHQLH